MTTNEWAKKIWDKLEELEVVDTDGLDPRQENAIKEIEDIIYDAQSEAIDEFSVNLDID